MLPIDGPAFDSMSTPSQPERRSKFAKLIGELREAFHQFWRLAPYVKPYWPRLAAYFFCTGLCAIGSYGRVFVIKPFMDIMQKDGVAQGGVLAELGFADMLEQHGMWLLALILLGTSLAMAFGTFGKNYFIGWLQFRCAVDVQQTLADKLMTQPVAFFNDTRKGELMSRVTNDLNGVRATYHIIFNDLIEHPIMIAAGIGIALHMSWKLAVLVLLLPLVLLPVLIYAGKIQRLAKRSYETMAEMTNFFHQFFEGIRVVKAYNMEAEQSKDLVRTTDTFFERSIKVNKYKAISRALVEIVLGVAMAGALVGGVLLLRSGWLGNEFTLGDLIQFLALLALLYDPVRKLTQTMNNMSGAMAANERVFEMIDRVPELKDAPGAVPAPVLAREIVFEDIGFEYARGRPVLRDISFMARKGTMTALVGHTGAGKSTLMDLIPRFYAPTAGRILVDGVDLSRVSAASWLAQIAVVAQETFLFNTTVRANLLAADPSASEARLIEALKAANMHDEIMSLPKGLDTPLGDRGVNLSGGQRQRLAIARAFVKQAPVLLLDEATSALDTETERKVQAALERLIQGATVFAIAHRLSTITHADQILVLEAGRIVESGTHRELLARGGRYALLYKTQIDTASARREGVKA